MPQFPHMLWSKECGLLLMFLKYLKYSTHMECSDLNYSSKVQRKIWLDLEHFISGFCWGCN